MSVEINKGQALGTLNITPMIDIVFLLLIFFLVASKFAEEDAELEVELPDASAAMPMTQQPLEVEINIARDGSFYIDGNTYDADGLRQVLRQAEANNPGNQRVSIRVDKRVASQALVTAIDTCKQVGIVGYSIVTKGDQ
jgi:biopolymer transport protein ExbD